MREQLYPLIVDSLNKLQLRICQSVQNEQSLKILSTIDRLLFLFTNKNH